MFWLDEDGQIDWFLIGIMLLISPYAFVLGLMIAEALKMFLLNFGIYIPPLPPFRGLPW